MNVDFIPFKKIARLSREVIISEKIDGTNAQIVITEDGGFYTGSRNRLITPEDDNYGFSRWANDNKEELLKLGAGCHYGEWWGQGVQRNYRLKEKRFSLFNTARWGSHNPETPKCCHVVPVLYQGLFDTSEIEDTLLELAQNGSYAAPGFMNPEGIIIYHVAADIYFKKTIDNDDKRKGA